jgi:hypothetical protein
LKTLVCILLWACLTALAGCSGGRGAEAEVAASSSEARADHALFALRCSKCHSLARPLNSGIDSDEYWQLYVARMRRQPGSGISAEDAVAILRFLHLYSMEQRAKKEPKLEPPQATPPQPDASSPTGAP